MKVTIEISCDNAAFEGDNCGNEIARILQVAAGQVRNESANSLGGFNLRDINGNKVGSVEVDLE